MENKNFWWNVELSIPVTPASRTYNEERLSTLAAITDSIGAEIFTESDADGNARLFLRTDYTSARGIDEIVNAIIYKVLNFKGLKK